MKIKVTKKQQYVLGEKVVTEGEGVTLVLYKHKDGTLMANANKRMLEAHLEVLQKVSPHFQNAQVLEIEVKETNL